MFRVRLPFVFGLVLSTGCGGSIVDPPSPEDGPPAESSESANEQPTGNTTGGNAGAEPGNGSDNTSQEPAFFAQFEESAGLVVMEMESVRLSADLSWDMLAELDGYTGDGYYQFNGNGICNGDADSPLHFTFNIETEGRYELRLRAAKITHCVEWKDPTGHESDSETSGCNHTAGTCTSRAFPTGDACPDPTTQCRRSDISNDAYVQIRNENEDYIAFVGQPQNTLNAGVKLFGGNNNRWAWTGKNALDADHEKWAAHWDLPPGNYTLTVEGRSQMFRIDRMVLFEESQHRFNNNDFIELEETVPASSGY
ncbi:MAG: hypothetical protein AAF654_13300 [Myxococcota bacterium]